MNTVALTGTLNTSDTGPSQVLEGLAGALADTGFEVYAFTHGDKDTHPHQDVYISQFEETPQSVPEFLWYFKWARNEIQDLDPDIIHPLEEYPFAADVRTVQWTSDSYERWRLCREDFRGYGYFLGDVVLNISNRVGASRTGTIVASSPETKRQMESYWRVSPDVVIPLGVDREIRTPPTDVSSPPRILLPGRITPKKGQKEFLNAFNPNTETCEIDIVGGVSDKKYWESMDGWHEHHHGFVSRSRLLELYKRSDIVAVPAIHENFSMVAVEAISQGCVVVITEKCGFAQLDDVASNKSVTVTTDSRATASAVKDLVTDPDLGHRKDAAFQLSSQFTWDQIANEYKDRTYSALIQ